MRLYLQIAALVLTLWLPLEMALSILWTCGQITEKKQEQTAEEYCSAFQGPLISITRWAGDIIEHRGEAVIALFTAVLAFSTIALWRSTEKLWRAGERQRESNERIASEQREGSERNALREHAQTEAAIELARKSAEAAHKTAEISERALTVLERPYVIIDARTNGVEPKDFITVEFANHGRSLAFTGVAQGDFFIADEPPAQFKPQRVHEKGISWVVPGHGKGHTARWPVKKTTEELSRVFIGETKLYFLAVISYTDSSGDWYDTGICNVYDPETKGLMVAGESEHNFVT